MRVRDFAGLPLVVLLSACAALSGVAQKPAAGGAVVPWIDAEPTGLHQGLATPVEGQPPRNCHAADLVAADGGFAGPVGGQMTTTVNFANLARTDCVIGGVPAVQLIGDAGPVAFTQAAVGSAAGDEILMNPSAASPMAGGEARVTVQWRVADARTGRCAVPLAHAVAMRIVLPGETDAIEVWYFANKGASPVPVCPPQLGVGPFQKVETPGAPVLTPQFWKAKLEVPPTARVGSSLHYRVTLQNVYNRALEFRNGCPEYIEVLGGPDDWTTGKEFYLLNCDAMGMVEPGASVVFEMVIQIPLSAPLGKYSVGWELDTGENSYGTTDAPFTVK